MSTSDRYVDQYDEDYFLRGRETGKSLYTNYRWLPELTIPMVSRIISHLGIRPADCILDFGCARGYVVRAFRELGYAAWGYDISSWAIENADPTIVGYLAEVDVYGLGMFDWIIAKDVLEHVHELDETIALLKSISRIGLFIVVPLSERGVGTHRRGEYDVPEYEKDVTHVHRHSLQWWVGLFLHPEWSVEGRYRVMGVKDNYSQYPTGNGFITCRRI